MNKTLNTEHQTLKLLNCRRRKRRRLEQHVRCVFLNLWSYYFCFFLPFLFHSNNNYSYIKKNHHKYSYWQYWCSSVMSFCNCFCSGANNIIFKINLSHRSMTNSKRATICTSIIFAKMEQFCFMNSAIRSLFNISIFFVYFPSKSG